MQTVDRQRYVPTNAKDLAYVDFDLPIGNGRCLLKPRVLAKLLQVAAIRESDRVLDVGCGLGYSAALLARLSAHVVALEESGELATGARGALASEDKVEVVTGPLVEGYPAAAPYDVIVMEGATEVEPRDLLGQLSDGGRLVCILGAGPNGKAMLYTRSGNDVGGRAVFDAAAGLLPGFVKPPAFAF
jgi:protein-L-isoaspartate(D-aspartate) O-methyltransferase